LLIIDNKPKKYEETTQSYEEYMRGKKIIVVGPAGYLRGQNKGGYIDSFDVVVRINHALPVTFPEDYGNKTNVLYHILSRRNPGEKRKRLIEQDEVNTWQELDWLVSRHFLNSNRLRRMAPLLYNKVKWTAITYDLYSGICASLKRKRPNTGIVAVTHLLSLPIQSLNIIGFDFYKSQVYEGYGDFMRGENAAMINMIWHDTQSQIIYMKILKKKHSNLYFDSVMEGILCGQ
jgi:hypothetical protein